MPQMVQQLPRKCCPTILLEAVSQVLAQFVVALQAVHEALKACYTAKTSAHCSGLDSVPPNFRTGTKKGFFWAIMALNLQRKIVATT